MGYISNDYYAQLKCRPIENDRHPLASLSKAEVDWTVKLVKSFWPEKTDIVFRILTLNEPKKDEVLQYLDAEFDGTELPFVHRRAWVTYQIGLGGVLHEALVNLSTQNLEKHVRLDDHVHAPVQVFELLEVEKLALADKGVQEAFEKLKLPKNAKLTCDAWSYGSDGVNDSKRMFQCYFYMPDPKNPGEVDSNIYAFPLPVCPVVDVGIEKVIRIDHLPTGPGYKIPSESKTWKARPPSEYLPDYQHLRTNLKPLNVVQPEGASFKVTENDGTATIAWQKWTFRVGFNAREGVIIHDVRYDSRPLFHRLSLSEMVVPYSDPRPPFHRKCAFDVGDFGLGLSSNNLRLGCDCLGSVYYLSGNVANEKGEAVEMPNVICIHEQDNGIGWKHTNYRTDQAAIVRNRELIVQSIVTVANYEYILAFSFNQAAELYYDIRATGIVSTQPLDDDIQVPFGTKVHPGVLAANHQHFFSLRVDPRLNGARHNRLVYTEAVADPLHPTKNPFGNGYRLHETAVTASGALDLAAAASRTFKIQSTAARNPVNARPVAYKIAPFPQAQMMLSHADSFNARRAAFAAHALWAVRFRDDELFAAGRYTCQSRGERERDDVAAWAGRGDSVLDEDLVLYLTLAVNHVPRVEDFPVMPVEELRIGFKPENFFDRNPAIDVPPSEQRDNKSVGLNAVDRSGANACCN